MQEQIVITGGNKLSGKIKISGSKNAALPIMAATILSDTDVTLSNVPHLLDISMMSNLLLSLGAKINAKGYGSENNSRGRTLTISPNSISNTEATYEIVNKMRASVVVLGPIVAKFRKAKVSLPGGCAIGSRPVNLHLMALAKLGATISIENGYISAVAKDGLIGNEITFPSISVGATENTIMAACLAKGKTIINHSAIEPEIIDLVDFLNKIGADIKRDGRTFIINGKSQLGSKKIEHSISADRIEAASYAVAALATKGEVTLSQVTSDIFDPIKSYLIACGANIIYNDNTVNIKYNKNTLNKSAIKISTSPYPGFPTDMQAQLATLLSLQNFSSTIEETIFENRFMHVAELNRMGANINISENKLLINGNNTLSGTDVAASDLRASMALIIAGLAAHGTTTVNNVFHLDRGYEALEEKLFKCGAKIYRKFINI